MFYILIAMCLQGAVPAKCQIYQSPPMFESHDQCAAYLKTPTFREKDIPGLVDMAKTKLPGKDGDKIKWEADCKSSNPT